MVTPNAVNSSETSKELRVTASIVVYNNPVDQIRKCVESLRIDCRVQILLVDNSENKKNYIELASEDVEIIEAPGNIGFGRGHNLAIYWAEALGSDIHLVVNPDITVKPGCVRAMIDVFHQRKDVVLAGPRVVSPDGTLYRSCKLLPTPWNLFARRFVPRLLYAAGDSYYELHEFDCNSELEIHNLSGAFFVFRLEIFKSLGGFDSRYFMYLEDVDVCRRASRLGKVIFLPQAEVVHDHGKGSYRSWRLLREHIRSAILYFNRFGWFFDAERRSLNERTLARVKSTRSIVER